MVNAVWATEAACVGQPELFFPGAPEEPFEDTVRREGAALAVCSGCPVREPCLRFAVAEQIRDGVWGGLRDTERRGLREAAVAETASRWRHDPHRRRRRSRAKAAVAAREAQAAALRENHEAGDAARSA